MASRSNYQSDWTSFIHIVLDNGFHRRCHQDQLQFRVEQAEEIELYPDIPVIAPAAVPAVTNTTTATDVEELVENDTLMTSQIHVERSFTVTYWELLSIGN